MIDGAFSTVYAVAQLREETGHTVSGDHICRLAQLHLQHPQECHAKRCVQARSRIAAEKLPRCLRRDQIVLSTEASVEFLPCL